MTSDSRAFHIIMAAGLMVLLCNSALGLPPGFYTLGDLPGGEYLSRGYALSSDGSIMAGAGVSTSGQESLRWSAETGLVSIGDLPGGGVTSAALGVSGDGATIVGVGTGSSGEASFRWTAATGMVQIAPAGGAISVSADGEVVVGISSFQAYRWTEATGAVGLGDLPGGGFNSLAFDVSADGDVVVGDGESSLGVQAFRWTAETGMVSLGDLPGGGVHGEARGVSADGSVIVGFSEGSAGQDAFRWTAATGMVSLGTGTIYAADVSADGSLIVGNGGVPGSIFVWDAIHGLRSVRDMLGLNFSEWRSLRSEGISDDGSTIVGWGTRVNGIVEGFIIVLPEPSTLAMVLFGGTMLARRRRES